MGPVSAPQSFHREKNIYIIGAQCTGKTSLVNALEASFANNFDTTPPVIVREVARSVMKTHGFTASDITSDPDRCLQLQAHILEAQHNSEGEALAKNPWIISDRSGLDPIIYASRHIADEAAQLLALTEQWRELRERMSQSLVFVCETVEAWLESDGVRLMPIDVKDWKEYDSEFCRMLEAQGIGYHMIPRSIERLEERVTLVWSKWEQATFRMPFILTCKSESVN
ncbi:AAA domain-containing protein [Trichoderma gracile]